jgi:hypothetical protein
MALKAQSLATMAEVVAEKNSILWSSASSVHEMASDLLDGITVEPKLRQLNYDGGQLTMALSHWGALVIATSLAKTLKKSDGGFWNFVEIKLVSDEAGEIVVTMQRTCGKTPGDLRREQEERAIIAEDKLRLLGENLGNVVAKMAHVEQPYVKETMKDLIGVAKRLLGQFA